MEQFKKLQGLIAAAETDAIKFYDKGNSVAGTRLRKALQEIKTTAQAIRNEVREKKSKS